MLGNIEKIFQKYSSTILNKETLYRIWGGANRLGDSGVHTIGDNSAFVNPAGQLLLTRRGKTRMDAWRRHSI